MIHTELVVTMTVEQLKALISDAVRDALAGRAPPNAMVDQKTSPLGVRRHGDAVRRRLAAGEHGATRVGRRWLLSGAALTEELERLGRGLPPGAEPTPTSSGQSKEKAELMAEIEAMRETK